MIEFHEGDIFESGAEALVNPVNCVGVSGAGLAKEFARRWPMCDAIYRDYCARGEMIIGDVVWIFGTRDHPAIVCFPTKRHWRNTSKIEWIAAGLDELRRRLLLPDTPYHPKCQSIAIPALGCGLGGLAWSDVRPIIVSAMDGIDCRVMVYGPAGRLT